jgi:hypothetical protein
VDTSQDGTFGESGNSVERSHVGCSSNPPFCFF